ncbi:MAG: hypothetical protein JWM87_4232 [Candidatus Eremiobacteraeota bacterium]|nr:hypothetical protein [Candidatus Eremiobacteraeota bacterium]
MTPVKPSSLTRHPSSARPPFFSGEVALTNGVYYLALPNGNPFGYYSYLSDPYIHHFDMGDEYYTDANDGQGGIYFYDFASGHWWYTSRNYPFPYLYDFSLSAVLYYFPDSQNAGHYLTNPRIFFNFQTNTKIALPEPRVHVWTLGNVWEYAEDGQGPDEPVFLGGAYSCEGPPSPPGQQCRGGSGPVRFSLNRPSVSTAAPPEYRNMIMLDKDVPIGTYGTNIELDANVVYDVRFQTQSHMQYDPGDISNIIWQVHDQNGGVNTSLGIVAYPGGGMRYSFNGGPPGAPALWQSGVVAYGDTDNWEIQFLNTSAANGWVDLYRNGTKVAHRDGQTVTTTTGDRVTFGLYYYTWDHPNSASTVTSQEMIFNSFDLSTIPRPVPPEMLQP